MDELKKNNNDTYVMLTNVYARLKNLIYEDIPKITWEKKFDIPNPLPRDQLLHLSPESFSKLKPHQDIRDNVNEWVEDTIFVCLSATHWETITISSLCFSGPNPDTA